jgi:hypothetical protein
MESHRSENLPEGYNITERKTGVSKLVFWIWLTCGIVCVLIGFSIILRGALGGVNIDLKGIRVILVSLAPGILFLISGYVIIWALFRRMFPNVIPSQTRAIEDTSEDRQLLPPPPPYY